MAHGRISAVWGQGVYEEADHQNVGRFRFLIQQNFHIPTIAVDPPVYKLFTHL
jgi:hypothetical protein